jgi:small multidrug resistance family-3 protein
MSIAQSVILFLLAGLLEIGGGYLVWQWWRNGYHWSVGLVGAAVLILYPGFSIRACFKVNTQA